MKNEQSDFEKMQEVIDNLRLDVQREREKHKKTWLQLKQLEHLAAKVLQESYTLQQYMEAIKDE